MRVAAHVFVVALCVAALLAGPAAAGIYRGKPARDGPDAFYVHKHRELGNGMMETTFISSPLPLAAGEVVFTDPATTYLQFPAGPIAIKKFFADIVDEYNTSVPLYEVYNHHWIIFKNGGSVATSSNVGVCDDLNYVFGIGAESRNTHVVYPGNYVFYADGTETWTANIHAIRTVNVPYVKQCIECHCGSVSDPLAGGGFQCCPDGSFCPTGSAPNPPVKNYFLRYTMEYSAMTSDLVPVDVVVLDASNCQIEYNVPPCADPAGECIAQETYTYTTPVDVELIFGAGHIHIGGINITITNAVTGEIICAAYPTYGNGTQAGNEKGYVVGLSTCTWDTPYLVPAGTTIQYTASYHNSPYHDAVMALFYLAFPKPKMN